MGYNPSKDSNLKQEDFEPFKNKGRADLLILAKETGNRMKIIFLVIVGAYAVIASSVRGLGDPPPLSGFLGLIGFWTFRDSVWGQP